MNCVILRTSTLLRCNYKCFPALQTIIRSPLVRVVNGGVHHQPIRWCSDKTTAVGTTAVPTPTPIPTTLTMKQKFKKIIAEYGTTVIVFHVTLSLMSLGGFYLLMSGGVDVEKYIEMVGLTESKFASNASTFVAAYAVHKIFAPVRMGITIGATPFIVRYLRQRGFLKAKVKV